MGNGAELREHGLAVAADLPGRWAGWVGGLRGSAWATGGASTGARRSAFRGRGTALRCATRRPTLPPLPSPPAAALGANLQDQPACLTAAPLKDKYDGIALSGGFSRWRRVMWGLGAGRPAGLC